MLTLLAVLSISGSAHGDSPPKHGQRLLAEYSVSPETVALYAKHKPSAPNPREATLVNVALADTVPSRGRAMTVSPSQNPYTVVLRVSGAVLADGDAVSLWRAGFEFANADGGTQEQASAVGGLTRLGAKAGQRLVLEATATPVTFKSEREVTPSADLVSVRNFAIDDVKVQVWQGLPSPRWREVVLSYQAVGVGLAMLGLLWWWRR
jgi:hypothetical protein